MTAAATERGVGHGRPRAIGERLAAGETLLLDAAMGSELDRRGLATTLPLWSARGVIERPDLVQAIHADDLRAGADVVTACTFRTTARTLAKVGLDPARAPVLTERAVALAMAARAETGRDDALVAGSIAPLEDCYSPELTPPQEACLTEHRAQAWTLAAAGADVLLVETMPTVREAVAALKAGRGTGRPVVVSFVVRSNPGGGPPVLLSGESLAAAVAAVDRLSPEAILVNCAPPAVITEAISELRRQTTLPVGGYANGGRVEPVRGWEPDRDLTGPLLASHAERWLATGARIVGGCCGTGPSHTAALRAAIQRAPSAEGRGVAPARLRSPAPSS